MKKKLCIINGLVLALAVLAFVGCNAAGSSSLDFTATVIPPVGGSVYLPGNSVKSVFRSGQAIVLEVHPEAGMVLEDLTYTLGAKAIVIRQNQFFMPAGEVTIQAKFASKYDLSVVLDRSAVSIIGDLQLHATMAGADAQDPALKLVWMSMNEAIVGVDQTGTLTAKSAGQTIIQVKEEFTQKYAECTVTVPENIFTVSGQTITGIKTDASVPQDLVIPEVIFGVVMRSIGPDAFAGQTIVTTVVLPDSLETIGARAFANTSIKEITIPKNVHTIELSAFAGTPLEKVHVQASNAPSFGANVLPVRKEDGANGSFRMLPELIVPVGQADAYRASLPEYIYHIRAENEYFVRSSNSDSVKVSPLSASAGARVAVNITPPVGKTFTLNGVVAAVDDGTRSLIGQVDGAFNFAMPENSVTVVVSFVDEVLGLKFTPRSKLRGNAVVELNTATDYYVVNLVPHNGYVVKTISGRSLDGQPLVFETVTANSTYTAARNGLNNIEFDIEWAAQEYTISIDNTGGSTSSRSVKATYGEYLPKSNNGGPSVIPTKAGYTFDGYYVESSGSSAEQYYTKDLVPAKTWLLTQKDVGLKAHWQAKMYTVTLDGNEGTPTTRTILATFNQPLPTVTAPTQNLYDFAGYADSITGKQYYNESMNALGVWDKPENGSIRAIWKARSSEITLSARLPIEVEGIAGIDWARYLDPKNVTNKIVATKGSVLPTLDATKLKPSLKGFMFQGFYSELGGKGKKYYDGNLNPHPVLSEDDIAAKVSKTSSWDVLEKKVALYGHWKFGGDDAVFLTEESLKERNYTLTTGFYTIARDVTINKQQQTVQEGKPGIQITGTVIVYFRKNIETGEDPVLTVYGEHAMADGTDYGNRMIPSEEGSVTHEVEYYNHQKPMYITAPLKRSKDTRGEGETKEIGYTRTEYWTNAVSERDKYVVGGNGGGAGIELTAGNALYLYGDGIVKTYGGGGRSAFTGQHGQTVPDKNGHDNPAQGGVGGGGAGGGGAGIGTGGGMGGAGAAVNEWRISKRSGGNGRLGNVGFPAAQGGILQVESNMQIMAEGGVGGVHGNGGVPGWTPNLNGHNNEGGGGGGGGGGAGGKGASIGTGGSGGSGAGSGGGGWESDLYLIKYGYGGYGVDGELSGTSGNGGAGGDPDNGASAGKCGAGIATTPAQANTVTLTWKSSVKLPDLGTTTYDHDGKPATVK